MLFFLFHSYQLTAPLQTSHTGAQGWTQSLYLMPESKHLLAPNPKGGHVSLRRAWEGGWQERWALGEFLKDNLVHGSLWEPGKCREIQRLTAFVGHAAGAGGGLEALALVPLTSAPLGARVCVVPLKHPPAELC